MEPSSVEKKIEIVRFKKGGGSPFFLAHAWLMARKPFIVPIPGTVKLSHFKENIGALNLSLTEEDIAEIEQGFAKVGVTGLRLPEVVLKDSDIGAILGTSSAGTTGNSPLPKKS